MKLNLRISRWALVILMSLFFSGNTFGQQVIVGTGTSTATVIPAYFSNYYSWSQSIYLASEINKAGLITKVAFQVSNYPTATVNNQKIYLYETSSTYHTTGGYSNPIGLGATLVYTGSVTFQNGWTEVILQTPFDYDGVNNLMIAYENWNGATISTIPYFNTTNTSNNKSRHYRNNNSASAFGGGGYLYNYRANVRLAFQLAPNDMAMSEWTYPTTGTTGSTYMPVTVKVRNSGTAAQSGFIVKYSIDNGSTWKSQTYSASVASGVTTSIYYNTLATMANMSSPGLYRCIAVVRNTGDTVTYNDTLRKDITICGGALTGTYTIGADASSDYPSISSAISAVKSCGIGGPITFRIKNGTYNKQVRISPITGVSASTPITFESFSGNPNDVVYQYGASSVSDNYVLRLDTSSYISFKNITFKALGSVYSKVVEVNNSNNITLYGNRLMGNSNSTNSFDQIALYISTGSYTSHNNMIVNNDIEYGSYGIRIDGTTSFRAFANSIINNNIKDYYSYGVYMQYADSMIVDQNYLHTVNTGYAGLYFYYCNGVKQVMRNKIVATNGQCIYVRNSGGTASSPMKIANNFLYQSAQSSGTVYFYYVDYADFDYNSIHSKGSATSSNNLQISNGSNIRIRNNNIINNASGYTLYANTPTAITVCDYNNFYTSGVNLAYWSGYRANLAALKAASSKDVHSISNNVIFFADDNLHVSGNTLSNLGTPIAGITTDYDGQTRSTTTPDIGADEFDLVPNDAGLMSFENMQSLCPTSASNISLKLANFGYASLLSVKIGWSVNGHIQKDTTISTILYPTANATVGIGAYNFSPDTTYEIIAWVDSVNGGTDGNPYNDTVVISNFHTSLSGGTYQIGSSASANFPDISSAISVVNQYGICGPVVFNIENGVYNGNYTIGSVIGMSSTNTITFQSLSGDSADVTLKYATNNYNDAYIFMLDNAHYINFKNLTFSSLNSTYARLIYILNSSHKIEIDACNFKGPIVTNTSNYNSLLHGYQANQVVVMNSSFNEGAYAIYLQGTSTASNMTGVKIKDNSIRNFYRQGIYMYYVGDSLEVTGNTIKDKTTTNSSCAIYKNYGQGKAIIAGNNIDLTSTQVAQGMYIYRHNYNNLSSSNTLNIYNNFIRINTAASYSTRALYLYYCRYSNISFNTIKIVNANYNSHALYLYYSNYNNIKNNIFDVGNQYISYVYGSSISSSDYNNYFSDVASPMYYSGYKTIAYYKTYSGYDSHSLNVDPSYTGTNDLHLHDISLNNAGVAVAGITTDIDGDLRSVSTPDIGADEYVMLANDAEMYAINRPVDINAVGSNPIKVALRNMGTASLVLDSIHYKLDANAVVSFKWAGYLAPLAIDSLILIGTETMAAGSHSLKVWSTSPNNVADLNKTNDTIEKTFTVQVMPQIVLEPTILSGTITNCGDSIIVPLKIKNIGGATLTGGIDSISNNTTLQVLMLTYGTSYTYYSKLVIALGETFTNYNLVYSTANNVTQLTADLAGKDVVIMPYMSSSSSTYVNAYAAFATTLQNFVSNGGSMIFAGQNYSAYMTNTGLWGGSYYSNSTYSGGLTITNHAITNGITSTTLSALSDRYYYFNGAPTNYTSLLKVGSYEVAGIRTYGDGHVAHLGYRYYSSNQNAAEVLASNTLKYIYDQMPTWLSVPNYSVNILPGDSTIYNFKMNSTGLLNGTYITDFNVTSNDFSNTTINVPCTLTVAGSADISTSTNSLTFGGAYVNIAIYDSLKVYNTGCGELIITNVNSSNAAFTAVTTMDTIQPGDSSIIVYKFLTNTPGSYAATSTIFNNDTNYVVNLAANATNPPALTATPNPMNITVTHCNDSIMANLQIQNTGGGTLTATVEELSDSVEILILTYGAQSSYLNNLKSAMGFTFNKYNITELNTTNASLLQTQINSLEPDMIIIPNIGSYGNSYSPLASTLQSFANAGGTVALVGQQYNYLFTATGLISGTRVSGTQNTNLTTQNVNDPITDGFATTYYSNTDDFNYYTFSGTGITSLVKYNTYDMVVRKTFGNGYVIVIGHYYNSITQNNTKSLISNSIEYVSEQGADWLQYPTSTAILSTGTSAVKPIKFNANGLASGVYTANIKITSNSPTNPVVYVPCTLTVLNQMVNGVSLGNDTTTCGALTLNAGTYSTYAWNTGNPTQTISAVSTGTYSVTVSDGGNCTSSDTISVTVNPVPSVSLTGLPTSACANSAPISLNASPSGGVFAGPGISSNTFSPAVAGAGTHTLFYSYTNIYNCTNSSSQQITVHNPPVVGFTGLSASYCPQGNSSVLVGTPSGGLFTGNGISGNVFIPSLATAGTHNITYTFTDGNTCSNSDTKSTIVLTPSVSISITGLSPDACVDAAAMPLTATPSGGTFSGIGISGNSFLPNIAGIGTHYIKYSAQDANSCIITDSVAVTVHALPSGLSISGLSQSFCSNIVSAPISGFPGGGVLSGTGISGNSFNPSVVGPGSYTITYTYTDVFGCSNFVTSVADVDSIPSITFTNLQSSYCESDNAITIAATPIGGTLSGDDLIGSQFDPLVSGAGSYYVYYEFTDANMCTNKDSFNIVVNGLPSVSMASVATSFCSNDMPAVLSGTPIGGSFSGNGVTGSSFDPFIASIGLNTLTYTYTDNNGCTDSASTSTTINQVHGVDAGMDTTINYNTNAQLAGIVIAGSGIFTFSWTPSSMLNNSSILSPTATAMTTTTEFTLSVVDYNTACVNSDKVMVNVIGGPLTAVSSATPATICVGDSSQLQVLGTGGLGNLTYNWTSIPAGFTSSLSNPKVSPSQTTAYNCIVGDGVDTVHQNIVVTVNPLPAANIANLATSYCNNEDVFNVIVAPLGGNLVGSGISGSTFDPSMASLGQNTIIYSMTNSNGCYGADTVIMDVYLSPSAYAGMDTTLPCLNGGILLGQQPVLGVNYLWSPNIALSSTTVANPSATPNLSINYALQATDNVNGCIARDTVHITVIGGPTAQVSKDTLVCPNSPVTLIASGGDTYLWNNGSVNDSITVSPATTMLYYVVVTQAGCADLDTVFVNISDPKPMLGPDTTICGSQSVTLNAGAGFISYLWSNAAASQTILVDSVGIGYNTKQFSVEVMDTLSCIGSDTIMVTFENCTGLNDLDEELFMISIYPNPSNGQFVIESNTSAIQNIEMRIMDTRGRLVQHETIGNSAGRFVHRVDLSSQPKGVYFIKLSNNGTDKIFKVLIQ